MPSTELPTGRYLSCPIDLSPDAGGQTRAMLMRNRIFVTEGGVKPMVATFNARTDLPERRAMLLERGLLLPEISTPNIYEHYRNNPWEDEEPGAEQLPELPDLSAGAAADCRGGRRARARARARARSSAAAAAAWRGVASAASA